MSESEAFKEIIPKISPEQWSELFDLIPEIEQSTKFGESKGGEKIDNNLYSMPYIQSGEVVDKFLSTSYKLNIVIPFDWPDWDEGKQILDNHDFDYSNLDIETHCKLITMIIRADRFTDGFLVNCFEIGIILKILKALEKKIFCNL